MTERTSQPDTDRPFVHRFVGLGRMHQEMIRLAEPRPGLRVLDVGCGTGNLLLALGRERTGLDLVGLDPDPRALAMAGRKAGRAGVAVDWRRGFAEELPFADASVDRVFSSMMLHHLDPPAKAAMLAELRRVLRPDGVLVLADMDGHGGDHGSGDHGSGDHSGGHGRINRRMTARVRDNGAIPESIAAAGFAVEPTVAFRLGRFGEMSLIRARPGS
jgi:ubiquinone/menaquinone biosynthesis C-methylase UbiE